MRQMIYSYAWQTRTVNRCDLAKNRKILDFGASKMRHKCASFGYVLDAEKL